MEKIKISIGVDVTAGLSTVWEHWTDPKHVVNWNFATDTWHCPKASNDLRPGGSFNYTMAAKDGSFSFDFEGQYIAVDPQRSIEISLGDDRKVWVTFIESEGVTTVTEVFEAEDQNSAEMQRAGWQSILDNFKAYVEGRNS
jgi:uncharacterized protein YndB with AHSA1/START domain